MKGELIRYLEILKKELHLDSASKQEIIRELEAHVEDSCQDMQKDGLSAGEALNRSLKSLGSAHFVARRIEEIQNQGTWRQALLAAMPHLFFAALFALKWLTGVMWLPIMFAVIFIIVLYGWHHRKPAWLFPWLGYSLLPVVAAGVSLLYLPMAWAWITLLIYIPLVLCIPCFIAIKFMKRDCLYTTLMFLPIPAMTGWFIAAGQESVLPDMIVLNNFAPWTGLTFLVLALSVVLFIRLKQRWLRIIAIIMSGVTTSLVVILASNRLGFASFLGLTALLLSFLLVPAFLEHNIKQENEST